MGSFQKSEYLARYDRAREAMKGAGMDALLVSGDDHIIYFTGMKSWFPWFTFTWPFVFILPADEEPSLILHSLYYKGWVSADFSVGDIRGYVTKDGATPIESVEEVMKDKKLRGKRIGVEIGNDQRVGIPVQDYMKLTELLPESQFIDASPLLTNLRTVKSVPELVYMKRAADILNKAYEIFFQGRYEGMTERQAASELSAYISKEGADRVGFIRLNSGGESFLGGRIYTPSDKIIRKGDTFLIDAGVLYEDYWSEFSRMAVVGEPDEKQVKMHKLVVEVLEKVTEAIRPGVKPLELVELYRREFATRGFPEHPYTTFEERGYCSPQTKKGEVIGHGIGLLGVEPPYITQNNSSTLEPGACVTPEPMIHTPIGTFHQEHNVVVTEGGCDVFSTVSTELYKV